jgi:hypothetical protein
VGLQNEASLPQLTPCASAFFVALVCSVPNVSSEAKSVAIKKAMTQVLTCFCILSNIRPFPGGSSVMVRTSRCFAGTSFQLGGPDTLLGVERFRCVLLFADFSFAHFQLCRTAEFSVVSSNREGSSRFVSEPHDQKGEGAARLAAG